jgi:polar amino acid transport system substrate-binding protein
MKRALAVLALLFAAAPAAAQAPATLTPGVLTIGLSMPAAGFQVGAVNGREVVFARGMEIDLANELATRLGIGSTRFLNEERFATLLEPGAKDWDVALAQITITRQRRANVDFSKSYLRADAGVLVRRGLKPRPASLAALRELVICAERGTTSAKTARTRIKPTRRVKLQRDYTELSSALFRKECDAVVADAPTLLVLKRESPDRYGALIGRIVTDERWAIALPKGSTLTPAVNAALADIRSDGTLDELLERWIGDDVADLPALG